MVQAVRQPDLRQNSLRRSARGLGRLAPNAQGHGNVVQRREFGQQVMELVDEAQVPVSPLALLGGIHAFGPIYIFLCNVNRLFALSQKSF